MLPKITVGITGHRDIVQTEALQEEIRAFFSDLLERYQEVVLLSPLASGADQWTADLFLSYAKEGKILRLVVPLPLGLETYEREFDAEGLHRFRQLLDVADEVFELDVSADDPYRVLGEYVVDHSDIVLALWDGTYNHMAGGTGDVVSYAKTEKRPLKHLKVSRLSRA